MGRSSNPDDETPLSEEARAEIEAKEDDFVGQVEEAQSVMKNVRYGRICLWASTDKTSRSLTLQNHFATWLI